MTNQEFYYDILLKKYNILKKNLIIIEQTDEKIKEFKNTIIEIDNIEQDRFKNELEKKKELTTNLNDEYDRLSNYIDLLKERNYKRELMLEDYNNIVKDKIENLEKIEDYENLDFYLKRLEDISEFLENDEKYNKFIEEKNEYLNIRQEHQNKLDSLNKTMGDDELNLLIKLKDLISGNDIYDNLDFDNLDDSISHYNKLLEEKERELTTNINSYKALLNIELLENEKVDYLSFVNETKKDFVILLEKKYILLLYKYINENNNEKALDVYNERINKLRFFDIDDIIYLTEIFDIINNYLSKKSYLNELCLTIESIDLNLKELEEKIEKLKVELNKPNIISLLKEFCIEKEYIVNNNDESKEISFNFEDGIDDLSGDKMDVEVDKSFTFDDISSESDNFKENNQDLYDEEFIIDNNKEINDDINFAESIFKDVDDDDKLNGDIKVESIESLDEDNILLNEINTIENNNMNYLNEQLLDSENLTESIQTEDNIQQLKENAIKDLKDINEFMLIDDIRKKSINIMKSVCESIS